MPAIWCACAAEHDLFWSKVVGMDITHGSHIILYTRIKDALLKCRKGAGCS